MAFTPFIESDPPTMANFNQKFLEAIEDAVSKGLSVKVGTYKGTGKYGAGNRNTLTFSFRPVLVFITGKGYMNDAPGTAVLVRDAPKFVDGSGFDSSTSFYFDSVTWKDTAVSWHCLDNPNKQANASGAVYRYVALGVVE